jgi:hypothetical protein
MGKRAPASSKSDGGSGRGRGRDQGQLGGAVGRAIMWGPIGVVVLGCERPHPLLRDRLLAAA